MRKWNRILNSVMITSVSVTAARFLVDYVDLLILRPEVYAMRSAPWYVGGLVYTVPTLAVLLICAAIKVILKYRAKKEA